MGTAPVVEKAMADGSLGIPYERSNDHVEKNYRCRAERVCFAGGGLRPGEREGRAASTGPRRHENLSLHVNGQDLDSAGG